MNDFDNFAREDIQRWMNKEVCASFYEIAQDEDTRKELDKLLNEGKIGNNYLKTRFWRKDSPLIEAKRRLSMAYLLINDKDTYNYIKENHITLFHGTNANALPGIAKHGLYSVDKIKEINAEVHSGEIWSQIGGKRSFISMTDVLEVAWDYMQINNNGFPAIIGTSDEAVLENDVLTCSIRSDVSEVGIEDELPLKAIKCICVPKDKVDYVKVLFNNTDIKVLSLSNIDTKYFWFEDFIGCRFMPDKFAEYRKNREELQEPTYKITSTDLKKNAFSRVKSKMQAMYDWIITLKEREQDKNDSKRL